MATYVFTLDGSPVLPTRKQTRVSYFGNGADQGRILLSSDDGTLTAERGDPFTLTENGTTILAGEVKTARRRWLRSKDWAGTATEVIITSYDDYASRRIVEDTFATGTLKALLTTLVADYLDDYGVALHASQADGPTLPELTWTRVQLKDVLDELATRSGYSWRIDYDKKLRMMPPSANAAPFDIADDDGNVIGDLVVTPTQEDTYANRIIGVFSGAGPPTSTETFTADGGSTATYTTAYPAVQQPNSIWPNELRVNGTNFGPVGWGNDGSVWYWDYTTHQLKHIGGGYVPANGDIISVTYAIGYPFTLTAEDAGEIAAHGPWDRVVDIPENMNLDAAQDYIDAVLAQAIVLTEQITYQTYGLGLLPGQRQHIQNTERDLDDDCVITSVVAEDVGRADNLFRRTVTLVKGNDIKHKWTTTYERMFDAGGSSKLEVGGGGAMAAGQRYSVQAYGAGGSFYGDDQVLHDFDAGGDPYGTNQLTSRLTAKSQDHTQTILALVNAALTDANDKALTFTQLADGNFLIELESGGSFSINTYGSGSPRINLSSAENIVFEPNNKFVNYVRTRGLSVHDGFALADDHFTSTYTMDGVGTAPYSLLRYRGSTDVTLNLIAIAAAAARIASIYCRVIAIVHDGSAGTLTVDPNSTETIGNGTAAAATIGLSAGQAVLLALVSGTGGGVKILASHGFSAGTGDVVGPASSVEKEVALFDGTTGKLLERATGTGIARVTSGVWGTPGNVVESEITLADNTTNDVSTSAHGFAPKAPADATKFLNGNGAWAVPPGGGTGAADTLDFLTHSDESATLPNSRQLLAGTGVTFDDSVANERTINASGGGGGLVLVEQHTASGSATLDFTTGITSTYDEYVFEFVSLVPASNSVLNMSVSTNGGSSWDSSNVYRWVYWGFDASTSGTANGGVASIFAFRSANTTLISGGSYNGSIKMFNPLTASLNKYFQASIVFDDNSLGLVGYEWRGTWRNTTAVNAIQFKFASGNITSGVIRLYGVEK